MSQDSLKRFTDCVYFLASPLTCRKGFECEFRHSDIARLNPRECWYWLSGSCLNPTCAFRHPPLDGYTGEASEPEQSSVSVSNTSVPCYYYFNGYCNKGERCSFLHDTDTNTPYGGKVVKTTSENSEMLHCENNTLAGCDLGLVPQSNGHLLPSTTTKVEIDTKGQPKEEFSISAIKGVPHQTSSPEIYLSEAEETAGVGQHPPEAGFVHSISYSHENHSSDELLNEQVDEVTEEEEIEREERWESSPGFDVLVDGETENLDSEDGQEYKRELGDHFSVYDFENQVEYDPSYPDFGSHYREDNFGDMTMFDTVLSQERKLMAVDVDLDDRNCTDLRVHLSKQRHIDGHLLHGLSRTHRPSRAFGSGPGQRYDRFAPEVRRDIVEPLGKNGMYAEKHRKHKREKRQAKRQAKRQRFLSEISKESRSTDESTEFSGPKSLAQINEEKRMACEKRSDFPGKICRTSSIDFEGPKPLREIQKDKGNL